MVGEYGVPAVGRRPQAGRYAQQADIYDHRQHEVHSQAVVAHLRIIGETAFDHIPAQQPLHPAQKKQPPQPAGDPPRHHSPHQEKQERQQKHEAGYASEQPVGVFHPKDEPEPDQRHIGIDQFEFGKLPVVFKGLAPLGFIQRRNRPAKWLPVHHRKAGAGEAHRTAEDHQRKHQQAA